MIRSLKRLFVLYAIFMWWNAETPPVKIEPARSTVMMATKEKIQSPQLSLENASNRYQKGKRQYQKLKTAKKEGDYINAFEIISKVANSL